MSILVTLTGCKTKTDSTSNKQELNWFNRLKPFLDKRRARRKPELILLVEI